MSVNVKDILDALHQMQKSLECSICLELLKDPHSTKCNHQFCGECIKQVLEKSSKKSKNKWYCPLCKKPVSKRSLTQNPRLSEIVVAVRNLWEAVHEDTGIPTGSPPLQTVVSTVSDPSLIQVLKDDPTPQGRKTSTCKGRVERRNTSVKSQMEEFSVFIEDNDDAEWNHIEHQSQFVSNINIRSSIGPPTRVDDKRSKTVAIAQKRRATRRTRSTVLDISGQPESSEHISSDDLLHMIDTMPFQPVSKDSSRHGQDSEHMATHHKQIPTTDETLPDQTVEYDVPSGRNISKAYLEINNGASSDCDKSVFDKPICLTTIAEADSSVNTSPCENCSRVYDKTDRFSCSCVSVNRQLKGAVTSTVYDSTTQSTSSLDTMQSASLLQALDGQPPIVEKLNGDTAGPLCQKEPSPITDQEHHGSLKQLYGQMVPVETVSDGINGNLCKEESLQFTDKKSQGPLKQLHGQVASVDGLMTPEETVCGDIVADPCKEEPSQVTDQEQQDPLKQLYGPLAPVDGQMAPVDGHMAPVDGHMAPVDGHLGPVDGQMAPMDGHMAPEDGHMAPMDDQMAPEETVYGDIVGDLCKKESSQITTDQGLLKQVYQSNDSALVIITCDQIKTGGNIAEKSPTADVCRNSENPSIVDVDFDDLVSLFGDSCFGHTEKKEQKLDKVAFNATTSLQQKADASPGYHGRGQGVLSEGESESTSDLCERVKSRQRHQTSDLLRSHESSPNITKLIKPKAKKRSIDSVFVEVGHDESARKKFRNSEGSHSQPYSSLTNTKRDESIKEIGSPAELEQNFNGAGSHPPEDGITELDNNEDLAFIESLSSDSDKATPMNEMVPASVSTSESCYSSVINPMIPHTERQSQTAQIDTVTESTTERRLVRQKEAKLDVCSVNWHEVATCLKAPSQNVPIKSASSQTATRVCIAKEEETITKRGESDEMFLIQNSVTVLSKSKPCQQNSWRSLLPTGDRLDINLDDTVNAVNQKDDQDGVDTSQSQTAPELKQCQAFKLESKHLENTSENGPPDSEQGGFEKEALKRTALAEYGSTSVSQGCVPDPNTLQPSSGSQNLSKFGSQGLLPDLDTLQPLIVGQNSLENACSVGSNGDMGRIEQDMDKMISELNEKKSIEALREVEKTGQALSQKQTVSELHSTANTPTQSSVEMDVITPSLFGNESPIRNESQKMVEIETGLTTPQKQIDSYDNNVASFKSDSRTFDLMGGVVNEKSTNGDHVQFNVFLESKNLSAERGGGKLDHGFFIADQHSTESVRNMPLEGNQETSASLEVGSCSTSQSISVLQDLEPLSTSHEEKLDGACHAKDDEPSNEDMEPVPKKLGTYATPSAFPELSERTQSTTRRGILTGSCEESLDTEVAESDVIPPTPPVKPIPEPVCNSRVQSTSLRISRSRKVRQMREGQICGSAPAKPTKICKTPGPIGEIQTKHEEDEIECASVDTMHSKASNSLMKNQIAGLGNYKKLRPQTKSENITNKNHARLLQQSETAYQMKRLENTLSTPSRQLSQSPRLGCVQREGFHGFSQICDNLEVTEDGIQSQISKPEGETPDEKFNDGINCSSDHLKSPQTVPCDNVKEQEDNGDSFRWTPCQGISEEKGNNDDSKLGNAEKVKKDECDQDFLDHKNPSRGNSGNKHETGERCDDIRRQRESPKRLGESPHVAVESDEGDSVGDEVLLTSVFLPKEGNIDRDENDDEEDSEYDEDELTAFSQELISSQEEEHDDGIPLACKAMDSTDASSTFLSEGAASTQKMEVLRKDVEEMEREMAELRAYLAEAEENGENSGSGIQESGKNLQEELQEHHEDEDIFRSLTPPPPLTPRQVPPMPTLSSPLKHMSDFLNQEEQSSDDDSDLAEMSENNRKECFPAEPSHELEKQNIICSRHTVESPFTPSEDDDVTITTVETRQEETPSRPRAKRSEQSERDGDELIIVDDRDTVQSGAGSLLLVKRRKITDDLVPRKSPVVSLLFTKSSKKGSDYREGQNSRSPQQILTKRDSSFIYSHAMRRTVSPIKVQSSADRESRDRCMSRGSRSTQLRAVSRIEDRLERQSSVCRNDRVALLSFVATRLNRRQLAEARGLAEQYGGKLASEFNSKTSHVILATDENMQVTRHSYTMKYLLGLALGKWIVSHHWITACIQAKQLVPENDYEVKGDQDLGQTTVPRLARMARITKKVLLFEDFDVLCVGSFNVAVTKEQLTQLLKSCGAHVFIEAGNLNGIRTSRRKVIVMDKQNNHDLPGIKDLCYQLKTSPLSLEWVTDSIANYRVQDFRDYVVTL